MVELLIATLASRFAQSKKKNPRAQWNDLKPYIKSKGLKENLRDELGDVNGYFKPRNLAAHAGIIIAGVAEATQIFRLYRDRSGLQVDLVTVDKLGEETATARAGYDAIRVIGRALDDDDPAVLAAMRAHPLGQKAAIIGRVTHDPAHLVQMKTAFGGTRIVDWLAGEQLPRIC